MNRPLPPKVREKLGKLMPLLASKHDGERVGVVAAIERVLRAAGLDWHDLTGAITTPPPPPPTHSTWAGNGNGTSVSADKMRQTVAALRARRRFNESSEGFLDSMLERADMDDVVLLSPKQYKWMHDLLRQAEL
jgi:hypothetical protein